jgi:hypothetical protein
MHDFKSIKFGYASAEKEGSLAPELLLQGYYDHQGVITEATQGHKFLFLGYKGSGKSAIGQRLRLDAEHNSQLFVSTTILKDFPFNAFGKVGSTAAEPESSYPTTWAWLLLLRMLDSFSRDLGADQVRDPEFQRSIQVLTDRGFLPLGDLKGLVLKTSKNSFKAQIPALLEATHESSVVNQDVGFLQLVEHLRHLVNGFKSKSQHIMVIDGLDDILTHGKVQYASLAALLQEVASINDLNARDVRAKIVLLCRTDLFELFPDANKNKIRRDSAVSLDWYHDTREAESSALLALADLRVSLSTRDATAKLLDFFPSSIDGEPIASYLLSLTRHTPRDFLQLLECIQVFCIPGRQISVDQVLSGTRRYSIEYFLPEIKDELVGVGTPQDIEVTLALISAMRSRDFKYGALKTFANGSSNPNLRDLEIDKMLSALYERSAIGTLHAQRGYDAYTFKYRNRNSTLGFPDRLMLHKGIWKALNVS